MKKILVASIAVCALAFASFASAGENCNIDPDWKQSKIDRVLAECKSNSPEQVAKDFSAYTEIANGVAEAIGTAAREIGVAANEFIKTDAGKLTVALVVWHVAGDDIKGVIFGIPMAIFAVWFFIFMQSRIRQTGEYEEAKGWFGSTKRIAKKESFSDLSSDAGFILFVLGACSAIAFAVGMGHAL